MKRRRWLVSLLLVAAALAVSAALGLAWGSRLLKEKVEGALGADSEVGEILVRWDRVEIHRLRIKAPAGWPAEEALRADAVVLTPDLAALFAARIGIRRIVVTGAYLSLLRTPQGKLRLLPGLLDAPRAQGGTPMPPVDIDAVRIADGAVDFFDASVRRPPLKIALSDVRFSLGPLHLPALDGRSDLSLAARLKSPAQQEAPAGEGRIDLRGSVELSGRDMDVTTVLRGIDLRALEPYLVKAADTGVRRGTLDLDVRATVAKRHLHAPGTVTLHDLDLDSGGALGLPRRAAVALMRDRQRQIVLKFTLDGNLDDPKFQLNESIAARFAAGLAESLGIGVEGLAEGAASLGQKSVDAVGGAFRKLFGGESK